MGWFWAIIIGMLIGACFGWVMDSHAASGSFAANVLWGLAGALLGQWLGWGPELAGLSILPVLFFGILFPLLYSIRFNYCHKK